jgi:hypothetical protein
MLCQAVTLTSTSLCGGGQGDYAWASWQWGGGEVGRVTGLSPGPRQHELPLLPWVAGLCGMLECPWAPGDKSHSPSLDLGN